jgi:hypothetical protein
MYSFKIFFKWNKKQYSLGSNNTCWDNSLRWMNYFLLHITFKHHRRDTHRELHYNEMIDRMSSRCYELILEGMSNLLTKAKQTLDRNKSFSCTWKMRCLGQTRNMRGKAKGMRGQHAWSHECIGKFGIHKVLGNLSARKLVFAGRISRFIRVGHNFKQLWQILR